MIRTLTNLFFNKAQRLPKNHQLGNKKNVCVSARWLMFVPTTEDTMKIIESQLFGEKLCLELFPTN